MVFIKSINVKKKKNATVLGIGAQQAPVISTAPSVVESTRVYVSGLPNDITEEEIEILFSPQGKIKRIKLYLNQNGEKKGDGLVTFVNPESVISSCAKLNGLDIGDGAVISVTKADFSNKEKKPDSSVNPYINAYKSPYEYQNMSINGSMQDLANDVNRYEKMNITNIKTHNPLNTENEDKEMTDFFSSLNSEVPTSNSTTANEINALNTIKSINNNNIKQQTKKEEGKVELGNEWLNPLQRQLLNDSSLLIYDLLPLELKSEGYPAAIICNAFPAQKENDPEDPDFITELEGEMLLECCKFGEVQGIYLLVLPSTFFIPLNSCLNYPGTIVVLFDSISAAEKCQIALNGRFFDQCQLCTITAYPGGSLNLDLALNKGEENSIKTVPPPPPPPLLPMPSNFSLNLNTEKLKDDEVELVVKDNIENPVVLYDSDEDVEDNKVVSTSIVDNSDAVAEVDDFLNSLL